MHRIRLYSIVHLSWLSSMLLGDYCGNYYSQAFPHGLPSFSHMSTPRTRQGLHLRSNLIHSTVPFQANPPHTHTHNTHTHTHTTVPDLSLMVAISSSSRAYSLARCASVTARALRYSLRADSIRSSCALPAAASASLRAAQQAEHSTARHNTAGITRPHNISTESASIQLAPCTTGTAQLGAAQHGHCPAQARHTPASTARASAWLHARLASPGNQLT